MEEWQRRGYANKNSHNRNREMHRKEQEERNKRRENAIKKFRNANMSKKVGVLKNQPGVPVFKGLLGYYRINVNYRNGTHYKNTSSVKKNNINFNAKYKNNNTRPAGKWWWQRLRSKGPNGATVYKNTVTGVNATSSGQIVRPGSLTNNNLKRNMGRPNRYNPHPNKIAPEMI